MWQAGEGRGRASEDAAAQVSRFLPTTGEKHRRHRPSERIVVIGHLVPCCNSADAPKQPLLSTSPRYIHPSALVGLLLQL